MLKGAPSDSAFFHEPLPIYLGIEMLGLFEYFYYDLTIFASGMVGKKRLWLLLVLSGAVMIGFYASSQSTPAALPFTELECDCSNDFVWKNCILECAAGESMAGVIAWEKRVGRKKKTEISLPGETLLGN